MAGGPSDRPRLVPRVRPSRAHLPSYVSDSSLPGLDRVCLVPRAWHIVGTD